MDMIWQVILCFCIGYACGCISFGYFVGKSQHVDIRKYGSGNVGTTNALRTLGKKAGLLTFLGDILKCILPILILKLFVFKNSEIRDLLGLCTGLGAVIGHNFPFYLHFKGGKGIAVMSATILTFDLRLSLLCFLTFFSVVLITRYVSLGSLLIATEFFVWTLIFYNDSVPIMAVGGIFAALAFYTHRTNIKRLLSGTENKLGKKAGVEGIKGKDDETSSKEQ